MKQATNYYRIIDKYYYFVFYMYVDIQRYEVYSVASRFIK